MTGSLLRIILLLNLIYTKRKWNCFHFHVKYLETIPAHLPVGRVSHDDLPTLCVVGMDAHFGHILRTFDS